MIKVHSMDPEKVCAEVTRKLDQLDLQNQKDLARYPTKSIGESTIRRALSISYYRNVHKELMHYLFVRVIQIDDRFYLVYGDDVNVEENGTGGFPTLSEAEYWFYMGGR